jgi:hypothetical protein
MSMSDDDLWRIFQEAPAPDTSAMSYTQACNAQDLAGLRAVERAARAAAFDDAIALALQHALHLDHGHLDEVGRGALHGRVDGSAFGALTAALLSRFEIG